MSTSRSMPKLRARVSRVVSRRNVVLALGVLLALSGVAAALRPDAMAVETAVVRRAPLRVTVDAEGRTRVRDRYLVVAPVSGRLERVRLQEGDLVRAGDVVAPLRIDDYTRYRLLIGLDDVGITPTHDEEITAYEARRPGWKPVTL